MQPEVTDLSLGEQGGGMDHGWGSAASLPHGELGSSQRPVVGSIGCGVTSNKICLSFSNIVD